jgi:hypothetical protein
MQTNKFTNLCNGLSLPPEVFKIMYTTEEIEAVISLFERVVYNEEGDISYDEDDFTDLELNILNGLKAKDNEFGIVANMIEATITCFLGIMMTDKNFVKDLATAIEPALIDTDKITIKEIKNSIERLFTLFSFSELTMSPPSYFKVVSNIGNDINSIKILDILNHMELSLGEDVHNIFNSFSGFSLFIETVIPEAIIDPVTNHGIFRPELLDEIEVEEMMSADDTSLGEVIH